MTVCWLNVMFCSFWKRHGKDIPLNMRFLGFYKVGEPVINSKQGCIWLHDIVTV